MDQFQSWPESNDLLRFHGALQQRFERFQRIHREIVNKLIGRYGDRANQIEPRLLLQEAASAIEESLITPTTERKPELRARMLMAFASAIAADVKRGRSRY
ncbi:MAG TPA: hypothetical protein VKX25_17135 [Bryobacteraceae bacterium]|jgi:hypothetical protein|nr:hypothetical protein [Bryobacteraceae bacterium]